MDNSNQELIAAAREMDRWLFKSCNARRFRRLARMGMPVQRLHDALQAIDANGHDGGDI